MTTTQTERLMALADRYAFHIPGSQHSDEARAVLLAALQEQAPKRLWGMAGFNPPLPNVGEKYTSIHEDDLGDHVTVTGIANASSPNIAYVFLSWDDGHYGERAIDEFWQEYALVQPNEKAREGAADCRIELVNAVHTLASHYENNLYKLNGDEEALRIAKGDIAHAMKIAAKWNWNGTAPQPAQPSEPAQPVAQPNIQNQIVKDISRHEPCHTCAHYQQGKLPGVRIHDETCYECRSYWGNKWEAA